MKGRMLNTDNNLVKETVHEFRSRLKGRCKNLEYVKKIHIRLKGYFINLESLTVGS